MNLAEYLTAPQPISPPDCGDCPVLPLLLPGTWLRPAHSAPGWQVALWRRMYPECTRLDSSGVCWFCQQDVQGVHVDGKRDEPTGYDVQPEAPAPLSFPQLPAAQIAPPRTSPDSPDATLGGDKPGPRWVPR